MLTWASEGVLIAALKADRRAGKILDKCLVRASPATADRKDKALVFTGGAVNYKIILLRMPWIVFK